MTLAEPPLTRSFSSGPPEHENGSSWGRRMNLVRGDALDGIVDEAVRRSLSRVDGPLTQAALSETLQGEFKRLLRRRSRSVRGTTKSAFLAELQAHADALLRRREVAQAELRDLRHRLDLARELVRESETQLRRRVEEEAAVAEDELVAKLGELFDRARRRELDLDGLQTRAIDLVLHASRETRGRVVDASAEASDRRIETLERRIRKLTSSLEHTEDVIRRLAQMKDVDPGVASVYRSVQGLDLGDPLAHRKKEMLQAVFDANVRLQEALRKDTVGSRF